jgi:hypothetical protein
MVSSNDETRHALLGSWPSHFWLYLDIYRDILPPGMPRKSTSENELQETNFRKSADGKLTDGKGSDGPMLADFTKSCMRRNSGEVAVWMLAAHPTLYTLHLTPYTLHPTPYTLHPTPYILHPAPCLDACGRPPLTFLRILVYLVVYDSG